MKNEITTIQLRENVKRMLAEMREKPNESYEDVIVALIYESEERKRKQKELMIEGCKEMYQDMIEINKEWETVDAELDWEWNDESSQK